MGGVHEKVFRKWRITASPPFFSQISKWKNFQSFKIKKVGGKNEKIIISINSFINDSLF